MDITLDMLLASRDERQMEQQKLLTKFPDKTLVCLTVVMPGRVKRNPLSLAVAHAAVAAVCHVFGHDCLLFEKDLVTGYEAFFVTPLPALEAKQKACELEERHPLGRLFDVDIISHNGIPLSRAAVGQPPRRCLICDREARYCMRNHSHTAEEIQQRIQQLVDSYADSTSH